MTAGPLSGIRVYTPESFQVSRTVYEQSTDRHQATDRRTTCRVSVSGPAHHLRRRARPGHGDQWHGRQLLPDGDRSRPAHPAAGRQRVRRRRGGGRDARRRRASDVWTGRRRRYALVYDSKKQQIPSLDFIGAAPADTKPEMFTAGARTGADRPILRATASRRRSFPGVLRVGRASRPVRNDVLGATPRACDRMRGKRVRRHAGGSRRVPGRRLGGAIGRYPYGASIFFKDGRPWPWPMC